jgi:hypothetical protein
MAQLTIDTLLLLDSFGNLDETVHTGDQVLVRIEQLASLIPVLEKNKLLYEAVPYQGMHMTMLILNK